MTHKGWYIIEFHCDESISEVPSDWVVGGFCYWPPYKPSHVSTAIKNCETHDDSWEKFAISLFPGGICYDYATARAKARKAEETSDLQSDVEASKKIKLKRYLSSEESGPDNTPLTYSPPPTLLLSPPPKMRKLIIRSDEIVSPRISYGIQEGSFSPTNIEIDNIDAGPSGSSSSNNSDANNGDLKTLLVKANTIIAQNNLLRTLLLESMDRMKTLENKLEKTAAPAPTEKPSFFSKFSYLDFPLNSAEK